MSMILRTILSTIGHGSSSVPPVTHLAVLWVHFLNWIITLLTSSLVFCLGSVYGSPDVLQGYSPWPGMLHYALPLFSR